jgi:hypothetical protein
MPRRFGSGEVISLRIADSIWEIVSSWLASFASIRAVQYRCRHDRAVLGERIGQVLRVLAGTPV